MSLVIANQRETNQPLGEVYEPFGGDLELDRREVRNPRDYHSKRQVPLNVTRGDLILSRK